MNSRSDIPSARAVDRFIVPRREERRTLSAPAVLRERRVGIPVTVNNLSCYGCMLSMKRHVLKLGQIVMVRLESLEGFQAVVRWTREDSAGVEFLRPLHPAVVDHQARHNPPAEVY